MANSTSGSQQSGTRPIAIIVFAVACGQMMHTGAEAQQIANVELGRVCRAAIATIMGRDVRTIRLDETKDAIAYVSYTRPNDGKLWKNRCRVEGDRVIWGTVDAFGSGSGFGTWRNRPADERIQYKLDGRQITITQTYSDGSRGHETLVVE